MSFPSFGCIMQSLKQEPCFSLFVKPLYKDYIMNHHFPTESESETGVCINIQMDHTLFSDAYTIIHCRYRAKEKYVNGGWVNICPTTFLMNTELQESVKLIQADNVSIAPEKHYFVQPGQMLLFTLFFPALPKTWNHFDLIEKTNDGTGFKVKRITRNKTGVYRINVW